LIRIADDNEPVQHYHQNEHLATENCCVCDHLKTVNRLNESAEFLVSVSECLQLPKEATSSAASGTELIVDNFELSQQYLD
jgi:hypothetical protein